MFTQTEKLVAKAIFVMPDSHRTDLGRELAFAGIELGFQPGQNR